MSSIHTNIVVYGCGNNTHSILSPTTGPIKQPRLISFLKAFENANLLPKSSTNSIPTSSSSSSSNDDQDENYLIALQNSQIPHHFSLVQVSTGGDFAFFLFRDHCKGENRLFACGYTGTGEHGVPQDGTQSTSQLRDVTEMAKKQILQKQPSSVVGMDIKQIGCGWNHSMLMVEFEEQTQELGLPNQKRLAFFGSGFNNHGQLSVGDTSSISRFGQEADVSLVSRDHLYSIEKFFLRYNTCAFITRDRTLYACGGNSSGEMGKHGSVYRFEKIATNILEADFSYSHGAIINLDGEVMTSGQNDYNKLGHSCAGSYQFIQAPLPNNEKGQKVALGIHHTVVLTQSGSIYTVGHNDNGECSLGHHASASVLIRVPLDVHFKDICCGFYHTCALSITNEVYICGIDVDTRGSKNILSPLITNDPLYRTVNAIASGGYYSLMYRQDEGESKRVKEFMSKLFKFSKLSAEGSTSELQDVQIQFM
ncbi:hypothetical protein C9374_014176 [Naegleria lovaniensis]|uniref:Uncharacterized protein n=1 Tax=Naegleria lovaniensis TaxID=51637 RepID=A0AA88H0T5_NAELO|nr:uncharacterized protein C9374_014176 [Naegleria lovaniensis]KAG2389616.1 hypothetical protein C9374_014176 [Naegleria lovaniensis]